MELTRVLLYSHEHFILKKISLWEKTMYGLIGKMITVEGQRDELVSILLQGMQDMPGCQSYIVAHDPSDPDAVWVTEVWQDQASHQASLTLPSVQAAIARGRPMIAGFGERYETIPVGGIGLKIPLE
ncbi:MAG TPA: putative quinol monooxygenase [Anaerolineaceae bacterium]|nr:putative quinol monooxygenase [Anaerolineaceae bacterium]